MTKAIRFDQQSSTWLPNLSLVLEKNLCIPPYPIVKFDWTVIVMTLKKPCGTGNLVAPNVKNTYLEEYIPIVGSTEQSRIVCRLDLPQTNSDNDHEVQFRRMWVGYLALCWEASQGLPL
jgi:hypothetical protein